MLPDIFIQSILLPFSGMCQKYTRANAITHNQAASIVKNEW
jgi:hypothetical protein